MSDVVILRKSDVYIQTCHLNAETGEREFHSDNSEDVDRVCGSYAILEGRFLAFFTIREVMFFHLERATYRFTDDLGFKVSGPLTNRTCTISVAGSRVCRLRYSLYDHGYLDFDPTADDDLDDFDFGLRLANINRRFVAAR